MNFGRIVRSQWGSGVKPGVTDAAPAAALPGHPLKLGFYPSWSPHGQRALNFSSCGLSVVDLLFVSGRSTSGLSGLRVCH